MKPKKTCRAEGTVPYQNSIVSLVLFNLLVLLARGAIAALLGRMLLSDGPQLV